MTSKVLVIGSGGREHALVWRLTQSPHVGQLWAAPGGAGMAGERCVASGEPVRCVDCPADALEALAEFAAAQRIDLTVVGPDNPLGLGIVDVFQARGLRIWGPNRQAAQFESSKAFAQAFMQRHGIPTARAGVFEEPVAARAFVESLAGCCAVKADGLALGKGVLLCHDVATAFQAIDEILVQRTFGSAGSRLVIQELLEGVEVSLHALCDGATAVLFPTSQDHKRALDGDAGLNTGGMGTYAPTPFVSARDLPGVHASILGPWLRGCAAEGIDFRGLLYPGVMLTAAGPKVLEFNARFGDPETQVYLPLLRTDLFELLDASAGGRLAGQSLEWAEAACVCVVMASQGYPGTYPKGRVISGLDDVARMAQVKVFHAGTARSGGDWVTQGGRVLGVTAWGPDLGAARARAYAAVECIRFDGAHYRRDIAAKALAATAGAVGAPR